MRLLIGVPLLLLVVLFALSNTQPVRLGLFPTDFQVEIPLSIAVLAGMAVAFLVGGLIVWLGSWGQRRKIRDAERQLHLLEAQIAQLRASQRPNPYQDIGQDIGR